MKLIYISGGQRSGKSRYAMNRALKDSSRPVYLATSRVLDDEMRQRVERHKKDRGSRWHSIEIEKSISRFPVEQFSPEERVVVLDCLTLWLTNFFCDGDGVSDKILDELKTEWDRFCQLPLTTYVVSNEIGMGVIPSDKFSRQFVDLQGFMNQYVAEMADEVWFLVSGQALKVK